MTVRQKPRTEKETGKRAAKPPRQTADEAVLAVAEKLFAQYGFDVVTTKQLATEAGVTIGALYHHFPSKEALYEAAANRAFSRRPAVPRSLFDETQPAEPRLKQLVTWFVDGVITDKNFGLLLRRELLDPRPQMPSLIDIDVFKEALELFKHLIKQLVPNADVDEALASMLALSFGFANLKGIYAIVPSVRKTLGTPAEIADHATRLLLRGLQS